MPSQGMHAKINPPLRFIFHILSVINCSFYFVALVSLIHVFVTEVIEQCKLFGLSSTVHSCLFLMCANGTQFYLKMQCND